MVIDKTAQGRRTFPPGAQRGRTRRPDAMKRMTSPAERRMVPETSRRNRTGHDAPDTPSSGRARGTLNLEVGAPAAAPSPFDPAAHVACTRSPLTVAPGAPSFGWSTHGAHEPGHALRLPGLEAGCVEQVRPRLTGKLGLAFELANRDGLPARGARRIALGKAEPRPRWPLGRQETVPDTLTYFRAKRVFIHDRESHPRLPLQPSEHIASQVPGSSRPGVPSVTSRVSSPRR